MSKQKSIIIVVILIIGMGASALIINNFLTEGPDSLSKKIQDFFSIEKEDGEPAKAYREYIDSIQNKNKQKFKSFLFKEEYNNQKLEDEKINQVINYLQQVRPTNEKIQIANEIIEDDKAFLRTQIKTSDANKREYGLIKMKKDQTWKVLDDQWESPVSIESQIDDDPNDGVEHWNVFTFCNEVTLKECNEEFEKNKKIGLGAPPCSSCIAARDNKPELCNQEGSPQHCFFGVVELNGDYKLCQNSEMYKSLCQEIKEDRNFIPSVNPYTLDSDEDGLSDALEIKYHTDLMKKDTDGDGVSDGEEVKNFRIPVSI